MKTKPIFGHPLFEFPVCGVVIARGHAKKIIAPWFALVGDVEAWGRLLVDYHCLSADVLERSREKQQVDHHRRCAQAVIAALRSDGGGVAPNPMIAHRIRMAPTKLSLGDLRAHVGRLKRCRRDAEGEPGFVLDADRGTMLLCQALDFLLPFASQDMFSAVAPDEIIESLCQHLVLNFGSGPNA